MSRLLPTILAVLSLAASLIVSPRLWTTSFAQRAPSAVASPDGRIILTVERTPSGQLRWSVALEGTPVITPSPLGIVVDGVNLGEGAEIRQAERYRVDERYPWRGVHATAVNRANGVRFTIAHAASRQQFVVDARVSNDAAAFRTIVEGTGRRVPDAATAFVIPAGATVWSHGLRNHYEDQYIRRRIEEMPSGEWAAPPVTFKLPGNRGYASITEA